MLMGQATFSGEWSHGNDGWKILLNSVLTGQDSTLSQIKTNMKLSMILVNQFAILRNVKILHGRPLRGFLPLPSTGLTMNLSNPVP
jgi:hypothetical protein